jgi:hypothetical protein
MLDQGDIENAIYEACLATSNALSGNPGLGIADAEMLIARVSDSGATVPSRAFALRLLDPSHKRFSPELWQRLYDTRDPLLVSELTRALAFKGTSQARAFLLRIAEDQQLDAATRGDALAGLAGSSGATLGRLIQYAESSEPALREEALRCLRFSKLDKRQQVQLGQVADSFPQSADLVRAAIDPKSISRSRPEVSDIGSWRKRLAAVGEPVDLLAGRRIFFHASVGTCAKCHRHRGRGSSLGPDLSAVSNAGDPDRLLRALLQPSREVDPQYFPRMLVTEDGQIFTGIMLRDGGGGKEFYRDNNGRERMFLTSQIAQRKELEKSMMPDGLTDGMTDREIRDLLAFLDSRDMDSTAGVAESRFIGSFWLDFPDGYGGWLAVDAGGDGLQAELLWRVGSPKPMARVTIENGKLVIDNQPVKGCTGGALFGDVTRDGPVYLQGDHTSVRYRNIRIWPRN